MRWAARIGIVSLFCAGCATAPPYDPRTVCRVAINMRVPLEQGSIGLGDLVEISRHTPAAGEALSAWRQRIATLVFGSVGAAALVAGFVMGFAIDTTQPAARDAGYGLVGGAIALGVGTWVLGATSAGSAARARAELIRFGQRCE